MSKNIFVHGSNVCVQCEAAARGLVKCRRCGVNGADNCALGTRTTLAGSGAEIARRARWGADMQAMFDNVKSLVNSSILKTGCQLRL